VVPETIDVVTASSWQWRPDGGYLFILVYGSKSDWVRNVLAAGHAASR